MTNEMTNAQCLIPNQQTCPISRVNLNIRCDKTYIVHKILQKGLVSNR